MTTLHLTTNVRLDDASGMIVVSGVSYAPETAFSGFRVAGGELSKAPGASSPLVLVSGGSGRVLEVAKLERGRGWRTITKDFSLPEKPPLTAELREFGERLVTWGWAHWLRGGEHAWPDFDAEGSRFRDCLRTNPDGSFEALIVEKGRPASWKRVGVGETLSEIKLHLPTGTGTIRSSGGSRVTIRVLGQTAEVFRFERRRRVWQRQVSLRPLFHGVGRNGALLPVERGLLRFDGINRFEVSAGQTFLVCMSPNRSVWASSTNPGWVQVEDGSHARELFTDGRLWFHAEAVRPSVNGVQVPFMEDQQRVSITPFLTLVRNGSVEIGARTFVAGEEIDYRIGDVHIERNASTGGWIYISDDSGELQGAYFNGLWFFGKGTTERPPSGTLRDFMKTMGPSAPIYWAVSNLNRGLGPALSICHRAAFTASHWFVSCLWAIDQLIGIAFFGMLFLLSLFAVIGLFVMLLGALFGL